MTERRAKSGEKTLLDLLSKGDIAGLEKALGLDPGEFERIMLDEPDYAYGEDGPGDEDEDDDYPFNDAGDAEDDEDWILRPEWLHPDCRDVCSALDLGTCCLYPDNPLVAVAVDLADAADRAVARLGEVSCAHAGAELARCFRMIPGLLAQVHAMLPRLNQTARAQLLCPVGTLASALDQACGDDGCPWGCDDPALPDRRDVFRPMIELVAECSTAIVDALGWTRGGQAPIPVAPRRGARRGPGT